MKRISKKGLNRLESILLGILALCLLTLMLGGCKVSKIRKSEDAEREAPRKSANL